MHDHNDVNREECIEIRDVSSDEMERTIIDYLEGHRDEETYPSDIAFAFHLDAIKVLDTCQRLAKEGRIRRDGTILNGDVS